MSNAASSPPRQGNDSQRAPAEVNVPNPSQHRRSIRLPGYDYAQAGAYFVTIVTEGREQCLGEIWEDELHLNAAGQMVDEAWRTLPTRFPHIDLDCYVVMPNHFHAVLIITGHANDSNARCLGEIVGAFKSITTHEYVLGVRHRGWPVFPGRLWQRNYYEHIIRGQTSLDAIRRYIADNPDRWALDQENAAVTWATTRVAPTGRR